MNAMAMVLDIPQMFARESFEVLLKGYIIESVTDTMYNMGNDEN